jgi:hypothetical protein
MLLRVPLNNGSGTPLYGRRTKYLAIGAFQDHVKVNFFNGSSLNDPHHLFNAGLEAKASRAIDLHRGNHINIAALKDLVRAAVALNVGKPKQKTSTKQKKRRP